MKSGKAGTWKARRKRERRLRMAIRNRDYWAALYSSEGGTAYFIYMVSWDDLVVERGGESIMVKVGAPS